MKNVRHSKMITRKILTLIIALLFLMPLSALTTPGTGLGFAYADADVGTWADLRTIAGNGGTHTVTLTSDLAYDGKTIRIPNGAKITIKGDGARTIHSTAGLSEYESMFTVASGGTLIIDQSVTLTGKVGADGQTCPIGDIYTKENFTGKESDNKKTYDPKGFFIQVEGGGKAVLNGTLSDFVTSRSKDKTPRYVAPVVANGTGASFDIGATGVIKNNLVGYIVNDAMANNDAQTIKQYIKGAGPNVPRVPNAKTQKENSSNFDNRPRGTNAGIDGGSPGSGITATAGAVIYKDGARGTIEGTIENNRADTGGIMSSGSKTAVMILDGTTITKNVGAQFGGGATVEQGGGLLMLGGTMSKNVAWFGGGAVFATQNGVDWLLGRMSGENALNPRFSDRKDGEFLMDGGVLTENTAFTRGGAVLADSNGVNIQDGQLSYNMARMLGGAMYVMGDHPKYEYTVQMTGLYVHDNASVSGEKKARKAASAAPPSDSLLTTKWGSGWDDLNKPLQTMLQDPVTCADAGENILSGEVKGGAGKGNTDDWLDGTGAQGTGGGVWLCAYGNTVFDANSPDEVIITNNWATGAPGAPFDPSGAYHKTLVGSDLADAKNNSVSSSSSRSKIAGGSDFHADTGGRGTVVITGLTDAKWTNENTNEKYESTISTGRLNLVNDRPDPMRPEALKVEVFGNLSRHGGGLAADGTFIFGTGFDQATPSAYLKIEKEWENTVDKAPVTIRVSAENEDKDEADLADVPLDGEANPPATEFDTIEELDPAGNTWNGRMLFPMTADSKNGTMRLYTLVYTGSNIDTGMGFTLTKDMEIDTLTGRGKTALGAALKNGKQNDIKVLFGEPVYSDESTNPKKISKDGDGNYVCKSLKINFTEMKKDKSGKLVECEDYVFIPGEVSLKDLQYEISATPHYRTKYDPDTGEITETEDILYNIYLFEIPLTAPLSNDNWPITEKYVNKNVHSDIINFDQEFTYDILAYVPASATEFTISDTLVKGLEFADKDGNPATDGKEIVQSIVMKLANNHKVGKEGTVVSGDVLRTQNGNAIDFIYFDEHWPNQGYGPEITVNERDLSITFSKEDMHPDVFDKWLTGRWVQVTFNARIKDEYRTLEGLKKLRAEVSGKTTSWEGTDTNKQAPDARDMTFANGDLGIVQALVDTVGPDPVRWAVEGPSRLFARSERGEYFATPMNDKTGNTWQWLDKDSSDEYYGSNAWNIADSRFNGREPYNSDTKREIKMNESELNALKKHPLVVGHKLIKGAEGGSRLFVQTEDAEKKTHIFTTPNNDKSGATWYEITEADGAVYDNAKERLKPDKYTLRMLDLTTVTTEISGDSKNWPVISEEEHEGMANQASYSVKFGNSSKARVYKTNTVTVKPEPEGIEVKKIWEGASKSETPSPEDFRNFLVLKANGEDVTEKYSDDLKVVENKDGSYTAKWSNLPKLKGVSYDYEFDEKHMPGFTTKIDGNTITNTKKREEKPEIEKYVNRAVHKDIKIDEVFTYDIIAYVTKDADHVVITDKLDPVLTFACKKSDVNVNDMGKADNHKVENSIESVKVNDDATVSRKGKKITAAKVKLDKNGKKLEVSITNGPDDGSNADGPVTALRGHWVKVTFKAKIDDKKLNKVKKAYVTVKADKAEDRAEDNIGNAPVISADTHKGVPNSATYVIGVGNLADIYGDKSNTVTVKPDDDFSGGGEDDNDRSDTDKNDKDKKLHDVKTGDTTGAALWLSLLVITLLLLAGLVRAKRSNN